MSVLDVAPHRAIQELEDDLGLSPEILAGALGVEKRSVLRWREGGDYPRTRTRSRLAELYELRNRLLYTFSPGDARKWLHSESEYLGGGLTPADALKAGKISAVWAALEALESGVFL